MGDHLSIDRLVEACGDESFDAALSFASELEPIGGPGATVKPPVYEGGRYQIDLRWAAPTDDAPTKVVVLSNVADGANRDEAANQKAVGKLGLPELYLDLGGIDTLPSHVPSRLSSWQFPHRSADSYLRDADVDGVDFLSTPIGRSIAEAVPWAAGPLLAWFPQALVHGYWQSHLGKKRTNAKHARAWTTEILGWNPASTETKHIGLKGDPLNLSTDEVVTAAESDQTTWEIGKAKVTDAKQVKLSSLGHGQVPFMRDGDASPAGISFARITQLATLSFAQLRRVSLGDGNADHDAAARALVAAVAIHGHVSAFGRPFALRSGADLIPVSQSVVLRSGTGDVNLDPITAATAGELVTAAVERARALDLPLDGWGREPLRLTPKPKLEAAIRATWPLGDL
jgi:CRISPR-associated protein Csb1